jgi:hypothetical protein
MYVYFLVCLGCWGEVLLMGIKGSELAAWKKRNKTVVSAMGAERASVVCCHAWPNAEW